MADTTMAEAVQAYPTDLMKLALGYTSTQILLTASNHGLFDELERHGSESCPRSAKDVALGLGLDAQVTERILNACVGLDLIHKADNGGFYNTLDASRFLTKDSTTSIQGFLRRMETQYDTMKMLPTVLEKGQAEIAKMNYVSQGQASTEKMEYNDSMVRLAAPALVEAFDLSRYNSLCDIAGGLGGLGREFRKRYPEMQIYVMEQSGLVSYGVETKKDLNDQGARIITFVAGNAFEDPLPLAGVYCVAHLCMYLTDSKVTLLLQRIFDSLPPGGAFVLFESLLNNDGTGPLMTLYRDVAELLVADNGERSASQYEVLLRNVGFTQVKTHIFDRHICYDAILAIKPDV